MPSMVCCRVPHSDFWKNMCSVDLRSCFRKETLFVLSSISCENLLTMPPRGVKSKNDTGALMTVENNNWWRRLDALISTLTMQHTPTWRMSVNLYGIGGDISSANFRFWTAPQLFHSNKLNWKDFHLDSSLRQSCSVFTNVTSALEVSLNDMRYTNSRFTYLLTYLPKG